MKNFKREITLAILISALIIALILWFVRFETVSKQKIILASIISIAGLVFFIVKLIKKKKDTAKGIPVKDEFIEKVKLHAGGKAFLLSLYFWLLIFIFNNSFSEREEMLGVGILGSAAIYGICFWYYKSTSNFIDKEL